MKKFILLFMLLTTFAFYGYAQQPSVDSCIGTYNAQLAKGYNALAAAIDNGFIVCGFAFGIYDKGDAAKQALDQCEIGRLNPANEVQGKRAIMTHCRIHEFKLVE
jgi:hypothetical protein